LIGGPVGVTADAQLDLKLVANLEVSVTETFLDHHGLGTNLLLDSFAIDAGDDLVDFHQAGL
jgi:hypothetical protein